MKVQTLVSIVRKHPIHERAWVERAQRVTVRRLRDDVDRAQVLDEAVPRDLQTGARAPLREGQHPLFQRDGWRCAVPGCSSHRNLHSHHTRFCSLGGSDEEENQITLCAWHHLRAVHVDRSVRITGRAPEQLRFELGVRPDGSAVAVYGSRDVLLGG